jgi:hypothetical protein
MRNTAGGVSCEMEVDYPFNTSDSHGIFFQR